MTAPAVSVLMPVYNAEATLARSVGSVCAQSRGDWELLLIDDGSRDGSAALAARLAEGDPRIRSLVPGGNRGAAAARNAGLAEARGRHIAFLDADDRWHPEKLARQLAFMADSGAALSHTAYLRVDAQDRLIARQRAWPVLDYRAMLGPNRMGCLTVIYDRARLGCQPMPELPLQHDYALWLRLLRLGGPARGLDEALAWCRIAPGSLSSDKAAAVRDIWRVWRHEEGLSRAASLGALWRYGTYSLRHRLVQRGREAGMPGAGGPP